MSANRISLAMAALIGCVSAFPAMAQQSRTAMPSGARGGSSSPVSDPWQQTLQVFDEWARIQQIYTPPQIAEMRQKMLDKVRSLSAEDSIESEDDSRNANKEANCIRKTK